MSAPRPPRRRRIADPDRDPTPVARALDQVTGRLGLAPVAHLASVVAHWPEVAGDVVARHSRPSGLRDQTLWLEVDDPGWATQLRHLEPQILARCDQHLGPDVVRRLQVRVTGAGRRGSRGSAATT